MRKLTFLLSFTLLLTACSFDNAFKDDPDLTSITGVLQEQKAKDKYDGTHLLIGEDKTITPLRSLSFNLSGEQYLNNEVQLVGFLNTDDNVFEVSGISVLEVLDSNKSDAAAKIHRNTDLGFEIKYYDDWAIEENENVNFISEEEDVIEISQIPFSATSVIDPADNKGFLEEYVKAEFPQAGDVSKILRKIGVDNLDAVVIEGGMGTVNYFFYRDNFIYSVGFIPADKEKLDNELIYEEMVNSFRFTGFTVDEEEATEEEIEVVSIDSEMEFTSFESLPYKFRAKYPDDWYYAGNSGSGDVLHHYSFSDEAVTEENVLISLDVISSALPSGKSITVGKSKAVKVDSAGKVSVYLTVEGQNYRVVGDKEYEKIILAIAGSIVSIGEKGE